MNGRRLMWVSSDSTSILCAHSKNGSGVLSTFGMTVLIALFGWAAVTSIISLILDVRFANLRLADRHAHS